MEILIFIAYALILFAIGIYSVKNSSKSDTNYFIGGWNLKFLQVGLSAGATGNSGFIMTGAVGLGYLFGIEWIFLPIAWFFGDLVYWKYFPVRLNSLSHKEKIISPTKIAFKGQLFVSIITIIIIVSLGAYASSQFVASAKSLEGYFGIQNYLGILITSAIILVYLIFGGFDASVRSDMLQAFMMVFTTIFILLDVTFRFDLFSNFKNLISAQTTAFYIPFKESSIVTIISFFLGWSTASIGFGLGQPQIIQRYFAAESEKEIKKAKWVYLGFLQFTWIGMTLFGFLVRLSGIEVSDPEATLAIYCSKYLHPIYQVL
jgi:Na+/proline symporter